MSSRPSRGSTPWAGAAPPTPSSTTELLTLLANELTVDDLSAAAGYQVDTIEEALVSLARDADADPERVRHALEVEPRR